MHSAPPSANLYDLLAEPAPEGGAAGETLTTKAKETVDNDIEAFALDELTIHA